MKINGERNLSQQLMGMDSEIFLALWSKAYR